MSSFSSSRDSDSLDSDEESDQQVTGNDLAMLVAQAFKGSVPTKIGSAPTNKGSVTKKVTTTQPATNERERELGIAQVFETIRSEKTNDKHVLPVQRIEEKVKPKKEVKVKDNVSPQTSALLGQKRTSVQFNGLPTVVEEKAKCGKIVTEIQDKLIAKGAPAPTLNFSQDPDMKISLTHEPGTNVKMREITCSKVMMPIKEMSAKDFAIGCENGTSDKQIHEYIVNEVVGAFNLLDVKGLETLSSHDLMSAYTSMGIEMSEEDCKGIIEEFDRHGEGRINFADFFAAMYEEIQQGTSEADLKYLFDTMDTKDNGFLDPSDIQLLFQKCGEMVSKSEAMDMIINCDLNNDGLIDFYEFKMFYSKIDVYAKLTNTFKYDSE